MKLKAGITLSCLVFTPHPHDFNRYNALFFHSLSLHVRVRFRHVWTCLTLRFWYLYRLSDLRLSLWNSWSLKLTTLQTLAACFSAYTISFYRTQVSPVPYLGFWSIDFDCSFLFLFLLTVRSYLAKVKANFFCDLCFFFSVSVCNWNC